MARGKVSPSSLTQQELKQLLVYNPDTGEFRWLIKTNKLNPVQVGDLAGFVTKRGKGYRFIKIKGRKYNASRLAWLYMTGEWPVRLIDHVNHCKHDDRFHNLREATVSQNMINKPTTKQSRTGFKNLCRVYDFWRVTLSKENRRYHVIETKCFGKALKARNVALRKLHGEFATA